MRLWRLLGRTIRGPNSSESTDDQDELQQSCAFSAVLKGTTPLAQPVYIFIGLCVHAAFVLYRSALEDSGLGPNQISLIASGYEQKKARLREILGRVGTSLERCGLL
jgi:hypothetical protein